MSGQTLMTGGGVTTLIAMTQTGGPGRDAVQRRRSVGRYVTALGPLTAGAFTTSWFDGSLGLATASVTARGLIAVVGLSVAPETGGEPMPSDPSIQLTDKSAS